jgi:hypothetical protein
MVMVPSGKDLPKIMQIAVFVIHKIYQTIKGTKNSILSGISATIGGCTTHTHKSIVLLAKYTTTNQTPSGRRSGNEKSRREFPCKPYSVFNGRIRFKSLDRMGRQTMA